MSGAEQALADRLHEVALLVSQAIGLVDDLASQDRILYAPTYRNVLDHGHKGTRKKTLGDAKREARQVATLLRRAWEIADPVSEKRLLEARCIACPDDDVRCPTCGEDGGTSCGMPNCGLLA